MKKGYRNQSWPTVTKTTENERKISFPDDILRCFIEPKKLNKIKIPTGFPKNSGKVLVEFGVGLKDNTEKFKINDFLNGHIFNENGMKGRWIPADR